MSNLTDALIAAKLVGGSGGSGGGSGLPEITSTESTVLETQTITFTAEGDNAYAELSIDGLEVGTEYSVIYDGVTYSGLIAEEGNGGIYIGNMAISGGTPDTEEPFLISTHGDTTYIDVSNTNPTHAVGISSTVYTPANGSILMVDGGEWKAVPSGGSASGGDVGMLIMPEYRMARIRQYIENMDIEEVLASIEAHPTGWDEECSPAYYSSYQPGNPDYDGATAGDYEETFTLHFGNIDNTADLPTFDVTLNLYGVHYELSCGVEIDTDVEVGGEYLVINSQSITPLYEANVVTAIPRISDTVMQGCYYAELMGATNDGADVAFYRLDGTPLYVYSMIGWETDTDTEAGYSLRTGEVTINPELTTISESELAYLKFKFESFFNKAAMPMSNDIRTEFAEVMAAVLDDPNYNGPAPVFIF